MLLLFYFMRMYYYKSIQHISQSYLIVLTTINNMNSLNYLLFYNENEIKQQRLNIMI